MAIQSESELSWLFDSSSARRCRLLPPHLLGDFWFISKRIICTHCSIACADKHGSCRYISSADFPISAGRKQGTLGNGLSMCAYANSLPQSFLFKASHFSSKRSPQSLLPKAFPQSSFLQSSLFKAPSSKHSKPPPSPHFFFLSRLFFFKVFSFKAFCSKRFLQRILKDIKGSCNQTSCCETLTRRNLSATKFATYVHLVFSKIWGAAVWREALLDNKKTDSYLDEGFLKLS